MSRRTEPDPSDSGVVVPPQPREEKQNTVLQAISRLTGQAPKVFLRDTDSEHGASPMIDPKSRERELLPKGRGNYQILGEIARGGMGLVLKGHDSDLGRDVALKVLHPELAQNPTVVQRFVEEAQIGGQLQHPGVVPVYELGLMADDRPYFTMKLIKGRTLAALLSRRKKLDEDRRRFLTTFEQICQTIAYAHSKGVIHRDLKPANVMVGAFGEVQVVDWGLAKVLRQGGVEDEIRAREPNLTVIETVRSGPGSVGSDSVAGSVMGTPAYMAPEQALGEVEKLDERADVFALGAILCEILTDQPPYVAAEGERTVVLAANARLDPARERITAAPADDELKGLCLECLSPSRAARPQNAEEVAHRIQQYLSTLEERAHRAELQAAEARVKTAEHRRRQRLTLALGGTIVASLVAFGAVFTWLDRQREARLENLRLAVDEAQAQMLDLQAAGRSDQALEVARSAVVLVDSGDVDDALRARAAHLEEQALLRVAEDERQHELETRNRRLLERCEEIGLSRISLSFVPNEGELDAEFASAFRDYGVDLESEDLPTVLETLRASGVGEEIALALDDWAGLRRRLHGWDDYQVEALVSLAFDLDPDPLRSSLREALLARDDQALLEIVARDDAFRLPASTVWVLYRALRARGYVDEAHVMLRRAADRQPSDFLLNAAAGSACRDRNEHRAGVIYLAAARGLRPDNYFVHGMLGDSLNALGDLPRAIDAYRECFRLRPTFGSVLPPLGFFEYVLWRHEDSARTHATALRLYPANLQYELFELRARSFLGEVPSSALVSWLEESRAQTAEELMAVAWALVFHPDPAQRRPEEALRLGKLVEARDPTDAEVWNNRGFAYLRLGRPAEALAALERADRLRVNPRGLWPFAGGTLQLLRCWALHGVGREDEADQVFDETERTIRYVVQGRPEEWEGSTMFELRTEVAQILGR